jgi:hypothetical protein
MFEAPPEYLGPGDGLVHRVPPGDALHAHDQRGGVYPYEVTVWPMERHHYRLTTGREYSHLGEPAEVSLTATERQICAILGLREWELSTFLREWTPLPGETNRKKPETLEDIRRRLIFAEKVSLRYKPGRPRKEDL